MTEPLELITVFHTGQSMCLAPSASIAIEALGAKHIDCPVWNTVISSSGSVISTPAYMLGPTIGEVAKGIEKLVGDIIALL